jgi:hypothetical protein
MTAPPEEIARKVQAIVIAERVRQIVRDALRAGGLSL